jgi:hypothetical protein
VGHASIREEQKEDLGSVTDGFDLEGLTCKDHLETRLLKITIILLG